QQHAQRHMPRPAAVERRGHERIVVRPYVTATGGKAGAAGGDEWSIDLYAAVTSRPARQLEAAHHPFHICSRRRPTIVHDLGFTWLFPGWRWSGCVGGGLRRICMTRLLVDHDVRRLTVVRRNLALQVRVVPYAIGALPFENVGESNCG